MTCKFTSGLKATIIDLYDGGHDVEYIAEAVTAIAEKAGTLVDDPWDGITAGVLVTLILAGRIEVGTDDYIATYILHKFDQYELGDLGARGDIIEPCVRCMKAKSWQRRYFHVNDQYHVDMDSRIGKIEIGHNGKQLSRGYAVDKDGNFLCDYLVYGQITEDQFKAMRDAAAHGVTEFKKVATEILGTEMHVLTKEQVGGLKIQYKKTNSRGGLHTIPYTKKTKRYTDQFPSLTQWIGAKG